MKLSRRELLCALAALGATAPRPAGAAAASGRARSAPPDPPRRVYLQPLGTALPEQSVHLVESALGAIYGFETARLPTVALPARAYYAPRRRYRAEKLLDFLEPRRPEDGFRVLGLTAVDISTTKGAHVDWGILGLASLDGRTSVLSSFRCGRGAKRAAQARQRLAKVAVHELGHTLGLPHCPSVGCLMEDAGGSVLTTDREHDLCDRCRGNLAARGYHLPARPRLPWPAP